MKKKRRRKEKEGCKGWVQRGKDGGWGWRRESDNRNVFSHRFTQAIALPFSLALIRGIIEQCGIPLKILLGFQKSNCAR